MNIDGFSSAYWLVDRNVNYNVYAVAEGYKNAKKKKKSEMKIYAMA